MSNTNNNTYTAAFFIVPTHISRLEGMTLGFLRVYETIFQFWNHGKPCYLSLSKICSRTSLSKSQVCEAINFFESVGELIKVRKNGHRFFVQPSKEVALEPEPDIPDFIPDFENTCPAERTEGVRRSGQHLSGRADTNIKKLNKEDKNKKYIPDFEKSGNEIPDSKPVKTSKKDYQKDERFMRFYDAYPKKVDPHDAYKAFKSVVGNDDLLLERILNDLEQRKAKHSQWADKQYIKYPAVYLRKGEYLGEIYNKNQELLEKQEKIKQENERRIQEQERISRERAQYEHNKHNDGVIYRNIQRRVMNEADKSGLAALKKVLGAK